ncbi:PBECR2 nuclease fold domain-containing protein [Helicobacter himalayensis]|uniref:PBECR2 nuclease fold domain-containing protein n=1 Tax=Helicobacter himalayensis TaxID=1591088 RepID=UPI0008335C30|nr:PBECR2 nuclease fold domain-containing protein [Helicobacter himalayensis]
MDKNFKKRQVEKFNKNKAEVDKLEKELEALKLGSLKDETFTDQKGQEHILSKDAQELWLKTFKLDSLEQDFIPFHNERIKKALGGKEFRLTKGSLYKIVEKNHEQYIEQIKETLEEPDAIIKDIDNMFIFAKELDNKLYFTSVNLETKDYFISISNAPKKESVLKNKLEAGAKIVYRSPNAKTIFYTETLLQANKSLANETDKGSLSIEQLKEYEKLAQINPKELQENFNIAKIIKHTETENPQEQESLKKELLESSNTLKKMLDFIELTIKDKIDAIEYATYPQSEMEAKIQELRARGIGEKYLESQARAELENEYYGLELAQLRKKESELRKAQFFENLEIILSPKFKEKGELGQANYYDLIKRKMNIAFKILNNESKLAKQEKNLTYKLNTKEGEKVVRKIFNDYKPDLEQRELFEKVLPMAQKLEVTFIHALHNGDKTASGLYEVHSNTARLKHNHTNAQEKGRTLLHELIHSTSSRALLLYERNPSVLNDMQKTAIKISRRFIKSLQKKQRN